MIPDTLPPWLSEDDLAVYTAEFQRSGFTGALNRYRNVDRDWEDLAVWTGRPITVPSLFIGGERDGATQLGSRTIARFPETLPGLRGSHILPGCGHWTQQERNAPEVNALAARPSSARCAPARPGPRSPGRRRQRSSSS